VFSDIAALRVGDPIRVTDVDGSVSTYVVEGGVQTPKGNLWAGIDAPTATPLLALVTCAGPVVRGRHLDNLTVIAYQRV
jgi:sortase (surface protein transpeptidase)